MARRLPVWLALKKDSRKSLIHLDHTLFVRYLVACRMAQKMIAPLMNFAKRLSRYWRGIVSRVRWPMHTGQLEGINNRIKVMKRMAYGYRDSECFFMKIKAAFPGNP